MVNELIDDRIMNQVMLRGCKYRVITNTNNDTVSVPIPISLRVYSPWHKWGEGCINDAVEMASERFTISKKAAQAYLDLHAKVIDMQSDLNTISDLTRQFRTANINEIGHILGRIEGLSWGLGERLRRFLEDEDFSERKDCAICP